MKRCCLTWRRIRGLPISDPALEAYFRKEIARLMKENDAPAEQYERMGLLEEAKEIQ